MMTSLTHELDRPVREIMESTVRATGLEEAYRQAEEGDAWGNVAELISTAAEYDGEAEETSLGGYLQQISLVSDVDHMEGGGGAVTLMTLHAAKGLEFPVVFIMGCEDGLLPFARQDSPALVRFQPNSPELEEERRLAFVGMTRAMDHLTLTCARRRMLRGRTTPMPESMFLSEIGDQDIAREDLSLGGGRLERVLGGMPANGLGTGGFYAETEERAMIEAMDEDRSYPSEYQYLCEGCLVRHPKFGVGKVVKLSQPWPETRATIHFQQWGPKKIVLAKTSVELIEQT
jgi:DNA helicase-2/ATP-dependent DNA helicase PcrA